MAQQRKINFKQGKYILPAILYLPLLGLGYLVIDIFHTEIPDEVNSSLQTTEYLNSELPTANVRELGGKRENVEKTFGNIRDLSAMENIEDDVDSLKKKEDFESKYTEKDLLELEKNAESKAARERYRDMRQRLQQQARDTRDQSASEFVTDISEQERAKIDALRRGNNMEELERELGRVRGEAANIVTDAQRQAELDAARNDSLRSLAAGVDVTGQIKKGSAVTELDEEGDATSVVKKVREQNGYFNTLSVNEKESNMIKAIVDEDIKAVDGSRVRLRLLDDIEIDDVLLSKGSYLYCTMSGFGSQRVKGKVESIMVDDELYKVSLSLYDTDGLEGLYVPESRFREAAKDVGGQALQSNMNVTDGMTTGTSFTSWASNVMQNGYQRISNAVSKNIRKNKAKIKYGTHVYLVNGRKKADKKQQRQQQQPTVSSGNGRGVPMGGASQRVPSPASRYMSGGGYNRQTGSQY